MIFCFMSDELSLRCPVCRAVQPFNEQCRRCRADLSLVVAARRRLNFVRAQLRIAKEQNEDSKIQKWLDEELWLVGIPTPEET